MPLPAPSQLSLPNLLTVYNRGLFAQHFLDKRLPELLTRNSEGSRMPAVFAELQALYQNTGASFGDATNEAQTELNFIQPVLDVLWGRPCYQVQVNLPDADGRGQPDYALFTSQFARAGAETHKGALAYWNDVAVVGDAKKWSDSLDKTRGGETPGAQLRRYLSGSNTRWGILTNGRFWRLYEQDKARHVAQSHPLAPADFLRAIVTSWPPFSVVLTLWVSITAAVGKALRPCS